jgi:carbamoyltransferase
VYVLGINATTHDPAVCLLKDGQVVYAIEEERLSRNKFATLRPKLAINKCLELEGIGWGDIDHVGYSWRPLPYFRDETRWRLGRMFRRPVASVYSLVQMEYIFTSHMHDLWYLKQLTGKKPQVIDHHLAHCAGTFLVSPFEQAAILSIDNRGEGVTTMFARGKGGRIEVLKKVRIQHSLGKVYSGLTYHLGFRPEFDEYKVMGLASYGKPRYYEVFKKLITLSSDGGFKVNTKLCNVDLDGRPTKRLIDIIGPLRQRGEPITQQHMDIAASLQKVLEEAVLHLAHHLYKMSKERNLCLTGGVAYNSVANGRLEREGPFERVYTPPCVGDAGTAIGSALYIYNSILGQPRRYVLDSASLGPGYTDQQIKQALDICKVNYRKEKNIAQTAAKLLADGNIVGWFQGRMEFGPRALGNRSILADPRRADMKDLVNKYVKRREEFRPFAPSVLEEELGVYFEAQHTCPFMTSVCLVRPEYRDKIPAVTHFDGTARIQTVSRKTNPRYWELIDEFRKITGIAVVLNTSFNVRDEPIVCSPLDALGCFYSSGMDYLAMGDYLVLKG